MTTAKDIVDYVPVDLQDMVAEAKYLDEATWQHLVDMWHPLTKASAVRARSLGQAYRYDRLREGCWDDVYGPNGVNESGDGAIDVLACLFCLSDDVLTRVIHLFDIESTAAELPDRIRVEFLMQIRALQ